MSFPFIANEASARNADVRDVSERKRSKRAKSSHISACATRDFLVDDTRVNGDAICSIGHYDYYDQVTATRANREGKWRQVVLLMNYRYYLPVCARENHHKSRANCDGKRSFRFGKDRKFTPTNEEMETRKREKFSARD